MKTKKLTFYLLAGILSGCLPVMSLHPLFTEKDLAFDEKLLGTWVNDPNSKKPPDTWDFKRADANENAYKFTFTDNEGKKGLFVAHLVKLENRLFLDVYPSEPPWDEKDPNKVEWTYNTLFYIPAHTFIKINSIEPQLKMQVTDDEKMEELLKADPNAVKHVLLAPEPYDKPLEHVLAPEPYDKPVLTASTEQLQAFVLKYADDSRVFTEEGILNRKKTKEPQESVKQKPNEPNYIDPNHS
jgi:hypothetical protein